MDIEILKANAATLVGEMQWLAHVIDVRMKLYWGQETEYTDIRDIPIPSLQDDQSIYAGILKHYKVGFDERVILALALAPHIQPHLLDVFFTRNSVYERPVTEFGGVKGQNHNGFIPTGETAAFILAGNNLAQRFSLYHLFGTDHYFSKFKIVTLVCPQPPEPVLAGILSVEPEYLRLVTTGSAEKPGYQSNFPAKLINTHLDWSDLVLDEHTLEDVRHIRDWITYGDTLLNDWGLARKIKPGFRTLFYGPPGTGKTLTASLLGKSAGLDVYRIDLSQIVSKYIGETEKNLRYVFAQAESKNWILFFDEADALFGKRTQTSKRNARNTNQDVSYLLQRIEDYPGVVILAANLKDNLDEAFSRRFQSMIYFPMPGPEQRKQLWKSAFSDKSVFDNAVNINDIAAKYELTGGAIINVVRYVSLMALRCGTNVITARDLQDGIRKEFAKDGKLV